MKERQNYYVYVLIDINGDIRYVGEGTGTRSTKVSGRTVGYKRIVEDGGETLILYDNLTKVSARELEQYVIDSLLSTNLLINKRLNNNSIVNDLPYEIANEYFEISDNSLSGIVWRKKVAKIVVVGRQAGNLDPSGYFRVQLFGTRYCIHRLVWSIYNKTNLDHTLVVNHIDSNPSNNNINNLEAITQKENSIKRVDNIKAKKYNMQRGIEKSYQNNSLIFRYKTSILGTDGKYISKSFSVKKYGEDLALELVTAWRKEKLFELYGV